MPMQLSSNVVEQWVALAEGRFNVRDLWYDLGIETAENKSYLRVILSRLVEKGTITRLSNYGDFRVIDSTLTPINWQQADPNRTVPLLFPFGEHEYAKIFPKSIIIVAGTKNAGKTAYLYNFIALNMGRFPIDLFNSETSPEQMNERFKPLDIPNPAPFNVYERYDNFADVINPDRISVIDYLDENSEAYLVGTEIDRIFRKLKSVAVIGLQKPPPTVTFVKGIKKIIDRDLAYGGGYTAKRAILYITMSTNKLKLLYVKTPAQPKINPNNMQWSFSMNGDGIHFVDVKRSYGDDLL